MKLYVNGCSHTDGSKVALDNDFTKTWPNKLLKLLDWDELDDKSLGGCSNDRIVRTTIESITLSAIPPDLAIIQFTDPFRFEIPSLSPDKDVFFDGVLPKTILNSSYNDVMTHPNIELDREFCNQYYNISNKKHKKVLDYKLTTQMLLLQNLFQNLDIPYIFIPWWDINNREQSSNLFSSLDRSRILNYNPDITQVKDMDSLLHSHGYKLCKTLREELPVPDNHYMEDGHQFIAESLYSMIKNKKHLLMHDEMDFDQQEVVHIYD